MERMIICYTDGSCVKTCGGYGSVIITPRKIYPLYGAIPEETTKSNNGTTKCTNQIAELYAIYKTISWLLEVNCNTNVTIFTDSKYCIGCLTQWNKNWIKNGWKNAKNKPVKNKRIIQIILKNLEELQINVKVEFKHVKAHNGDKWNEVADKLANKGRTNYSI